MEIKFLKTELFPPNFKAEELSFSSIVWKLLTKLVLPVITVLQIRGG